MEKSIKGDRMKEDIIRIAEKAITTSIEKELVGYNKPLSNYVNEVLEEHKKDFISLIDEEVTKILNATQFKKSLSTALNDKLARVLVARLGGELEKQVNMLKANPETRAKITLAISKIINEVSKDE